MAQDYTKMAQEILRNIGGEENVVSLIHCQTRLRFNVKDKEKVNKEALSQVEGVIQVLEAGGQHQVVIGKHVVDVYDAVFENSNIKRPGGETVSDGDEALHASGGNLLAMFMETVSGIFGPVIPVMAGAGMLKALLVLCTTFGWLTTDEGTYRILYAAADGIFTYIPLFLGYTSAKKFGATPYLGMAIAAALISSDIAAAKTAGEALDFLGIPVTLVSYTSTVMPIIFANYAMSKLEKALRKVVPEAVSFLVPLVCLVVIVPCTFLVIGPVTDWLGKSLSNAYVALVGLNPVVAGGILGFIWPCCVMFGVHMGFVPIVLNNIATLGHDTLFVITGPNNFAQAGACLGVLLKTKNERVREVALPAAVTGLLSGVVEPAIYGINLKYKRPFVIGMIFSGIAGAIVAAAGTYVPALIGTSLLTLPAYVASGMGAFIGFLIASAIAYFGSAIVTFLFGFNDDMVLNA